LLTDNYVDKLRAEVEVFSSNSKVFDEIELFGEDTRLRLSDCPLLGPRKLKFVSENHGDHKWTCECLKIRHNNLTDEYLRRQFLRSRVYKWIDEKLNEHGSMSFGHVSSVLHGELADDPTPFRREVKIVVSSLFEWLEFVDLGAIKMVMHNHTISICKSV
jgi:hypothetical protein